LKLVALADEHNTTNAPIVVHCSAGLGRTGTFIVVHHVFEQARAEKSMFKELSVPTMVLELRRQRHGMVQSPEQSMFIYKSLSEGLVQQAPIGDLKQSTLEKTRGKQGTGNHYQSFTAVNHYQALSPVLAAAQKK
jgi:protein-tyrosine phosphatase